MDHFRIKNTDTHSESYQRVKTIYGLPFLSEYFAKQNWVRYVPFCPGYGEKAPLDQENLDINGQLDINDPTFSRSTADLVNSEVTEM